MSTLNECTDQSQEDLSFIARFLHYRGDQCEVLDADEQWDLMCMGDGFGPCSPEQLAEINSGWDWSHVRDSSPNALSGMRRALEAKLKEKGFDIEKASSTAPRI